MDGVNLHFCVDSRAQSLMSLLRGSKTTFSLNSNAIILQSMESNQLNLFPHIGIMVYYTCVRLIRIQKEK